MDQNPELNPAAERAIDIYVTQQFRKYATYFGIGNLTAIIAGACYIIFALPSQTATTVATQMTSVQVLVDKLAEKTAMEVHATSKVCLLYTSPSPRDATLSRMPSSA